MSSRESNQAVEYVCEVCEERTVEPIHDNEEGLSFCGRCAFEMQAAMTADLRGLVEELIDPDPCWFDHHGYCQAHKLHEKPCPHERAKDLLAELSGTSDSPDDLTP